jgi:hypothetical protein
MALNRRQLLKMAVATPFVSLATVRMHGLPWGAATIPEAPGAAWGSPTFMNSPCRCISILLHGLFFLEYQDNILVAAAPKTKLHEHRYFVRDHGGTPLELKGIPDMSDLKASNPIPKDSYPAEMLRFSKGAVSIRGNLIDPTALDKHSLILKLPIPNGIAPLRLGPFTDFHPKPATGNIANSITGLHRGQPNVSVITWLQYDPDPDIGFVTRSFYAEHDHRASPTEVNNILQEIHDNINQSFDLQIENRQVNSYPCDNNLPTEITQEDETSLADLLHHQPCYTPPPPGTVAGLAVEVATCPQFGVMS